MGVLVVPESLAHKYLAEVDAVVLRYKKELAHAIRDYRRL